MGLTVAVDFDGTIVHHLYPAIGEEVPGAFKVLELLKLRGDRVFLWTMRSGEELKAAINWLERRSPGLFDGFNENLEQRSWTQSPKLFANYYIDDAALGCPLVHIPNRRPVVDWIAVEKAILGQV